MYGSVILLCSSGTCNSSHSPFPFHPLRDTRCPALSAATASPKHLLLFMVHRPIKSLCFVRHEVVELNARRCLVATAAILFQQGRQVDATLACPERPLRPAILRDVEPGGDINIRLVRQQKVTHVADHEPRAVHYSHAKPVEAVVAYVVVLRQLLHVLVVGTQDVDAAIRYIFERARIDLVPRTSVM